ncbi:hypothetical protein SDC9_128882 [bioreactor metagenome]|uniref:Uncharacterized protein n=1 Tax=bioreactor metagenome TaxID=1076179 RepID=A0A645CY92_9ZZZZ
MLLRRKVTLCLRAALCREDEFQQLIDSFIQQGFVQPPLPHSRNNLAVGRPKCRWHLQLIPGDQSRDAVIFAAPIGNHNAFKSPFPV